MRSTEGHVAADLILSLLSLSKGQEPVAAVDIMVCLLALSKDEPRRACPCGLNRLLALQVLLHAIDHEAQACLEHRLGIDGARREH